MENEIWKDIPGYEGYYQASTEGRIRSIDRMIARKGNNTLWHIKGTILHYSYDDHGYKHVTLTKNNRVRSVSIHRLIGLTFLGDCPEGCEIDHINQIRDDNRLVNLRWLKRTINRGRGTLGKKLPEYRNKMGNNPRAKEVEVLEDGRLIGHYKCAKEITKRHGINYSTVRYKLQKGELVIDNQTFRYASTS